MTKLIEMEEKFNDIDNSSKTLDDKVAASKLTYKTASEIFIMMKTSHQKILELCIRTDFDTHVQAFFKVQKIIDKMFIGLENLEMRQKERDVLKKSAKIEGVKLYKFFGNENEKYVKFFRWHEMATELLLHQSYSNYEKLNILKANLGGDAAK